MYLGRSGPSYETPAEVIAFRAMGADAVGMSTVPEAIVAVQCGMKIICISLVVSMKTPDSPPFDHHWVVKVVTSVVKRFVKIVDEFLPSI